MSTKIEWQEDEYRLVINGEPTEFVWDPTYAKGNCPHREFDAMIAAACKVAVAHTESRVKRELASKLGKILFDHKE